MSLGPVTGYATTGRKTREEALLMAKDALVAAVGAHFRLRRQPPLPGRPGQEAVPLQPVAASKIALHVAVRDQGVSNVRLGKMLGISETAARRLVNPDHRSHIGQVHKALKALGRNLVIEDVAA